MKTLQEMDKLFYEKLMYESPITQIIADISSQVREAQDGRLIYEVQQAIGYEIDKEELIKALNYDRDQYQKGYEDGRKDNEWIPVSERLPSSEEYIENNGLFIVSDGNRSYSEWFDIYDKQKFGEPTMNGFRIDYCVIAWKPLPEPYKGVNE